MTYLSKYDKAMLRRLNVTLAKNEFYFIERKALPAD
jgi:hypothetical protein